jgi:hypothetical protein
LLRVGFNRNIQKIKVFRDLKGKPVGGKRVPTGSPWWKEGFFFNVRWLLKLINISQLKNYRVKLKGGKRI